MANPGHYQKLRRGVNEWNEWRKNHRNVIPDLSYLGAFELSELDLSGVDFFEADLTGTLFCNSILIKADLRNSNLFGANMQGANLQRANLQGANLRKSNLTFTTLVQANLHNADLSDSNLSNANCTEALIAGACLINVIVKEVKFKNVDFSEKDYSGQRFFKCDFRGASFKNSVVKCTNFFSSNFQDANLEYADFENSLFERANFLGAQLRGASFHGANLKFIKVNKDILSYFSEDLRHRYSSTWNVGECEETEQESMGDSIIFNTIPSKLRTSFQQYLLYFNEYLCWTTGRDIKIDIISIGDGLMIDIKNSANLSTDVIMNYLNEYMAFVKQSVDELKIRSRPDLGKEETDAFKLLLRNEVASMRYRMEIVRQREKIKATEEVAEKFYRLLDKHASSGPVQVCYQKSNPYLLSAGDNTMGDNYNINGQTGVVGKNASTGSVGLNQNNLSIEAELNLSELAGELSMLASSIKKMKWSEQGEEAFNIITKAEEAAIKGDAEKTKKYLSKVGDWVLSLANKIGVSLVVKILKDLL